MLNIPPKIGVQPSRNLSLFEDTWEKVEGSPCDVLLYMLFKQGQFNSNYIKMYIGILKLKQFIFCFKLMERRTAEQHYR